MLGKIETINENYRGIILGDDGIEYHFNRSNIEKDADLLREGMVVQFSVNHQANNLSYKKASSIQIDKKATNGAQFIYGKVISINEYKRGIILGSDNEEYHFKPDNIESGMNEIKKGFIS